MGAFDTIKQMLDEYGLGSLAEWAWGRFQAGVSLDQISIELYEQPAFQQTYPEYKILAAKGRAYSVGELQAYRKAVTGIATMYGIPEQFLSSEVLSDLAANEVSVAEVSKRVAKYAEAAFQVPQVVRDELERFYNVTPGDLIAFWIDPDVAEPILTQKFTSAQIGAASRQTGYGTLTRDEAERLQGIGVDAQTAAQGFGTLASSRELFNPLAGEDEIGRETQLGAAFGGDADAQATIGRRRGRRVAEFSGGGGFATSREGIVGVG